jgi:hypothetical protein
MMHIIYRYVSFESPINNPEGRLFILLPYIFLKKRS